MKRETQRDNAYLGDYLKIVQIKYDLYLINRVKYEEKISYCDNSKVSINNDFAYIFAQSHLCSGISITTCPNLYLDPSGPHFCTVDSTLVGSILDDGRSSMWQLRKKTGTYPLRGFPGRDGVNAKSLSIRV